MITRNVNTDILQRTLSTISGVFFLLYQPINHSSRLIYSMKLQIYSQNIRYVDQLNKMKQTYVEGKTHCYRMLITYMYT